MVIVDSPPPPPSAAIKGLLPFTEDDGKLFARLGRSIELQRLLAITQSDQIGAALFAANPGQEKARSCGLDSPLALGRSTLFIGRQFQPLRPRPCSTPSGAASLM